MNVTMESLTGTDEKEKLGECRSVTMTCISEMGWHDTTQMLADIKASEGPGASQWNKTWQSQNAAGSSSLIEIELLDGTQRKFLIDCGWDEEYMRQRFEDSGVATMLERGEIEFLFLSHEHLDHLWGLQTVFRYRPDITLRIPSTLSDKAQAFIRGELKAPTHTDSRPLIRHTGKIITTVPGIPTLLYPGCVAVTFDLPILLGIRGEQSLYFRVQDKGTVCVTGCCHQGVTTLAEYAVDHVASEPTLYGLYGGLHIAPFGALTSEQDKMIRDLLRFGFQKIAANHCTGLPAVERMIELGYPIVKNSSENVPEKNQILGNGDKVIFG